MKSERIAIKRTMLLLATSLPLLMGQTCAVPIDLDLVLDPTGMEDSNGGGGSPDASSLTIAGRIGVPSNLVIDGDTNDRNNRRIDNNAERLENTQAVPNPVVVSGFLGFIDAQRDATDVYRAELAADQVVSLVINDAKRNDFDLFLYDHLGEPVSSSEGIEEFESVRAPFDGLFFIEVYGYSVVAHQDRGGRYTLTIGDPSIAGQSPAPRRGISSLDRFVEGEVLVKPLHREKAAALRRIHRDAGWETVCDGSHAGGCQRLRVSAETDAARAAQPTQDPIAPSLRRPNSITIARVKELRRRADVEYATPNYLNRAYGIPNDELYPWQWHYTLIRLPEAWDITVGRNDVTIAVIDTGVVLDHPDLTAQFVPGFDFISDPTAARDGDGIDANPYDPGDSVDPHVPHSYHGTHVAGTAAAQTNNGIGVAGVAGNVRIMPLRVLGVDGGTDYDIMQAIRFAAGLPNDSRTVPAQRADVINLSLGRPGAFSPVYQQTIDAARAEGVIIVAASGNESLSSDNDLPSSLDGVISVSAVGPTGERAPYSNFGSTIDVAAPGGDIEIDGNRDGQPDGVLSTVAYEYGFLDGTSMAAPHIAGVVALMKSVHPNLTPRDVDQLLAGTHPGTSRRITRDLGEAGHDHLYGHGLIDAFEAVQAAIEITGVAPGDHDDAPTSPRPDTPDDVVAPPSIVAGEVGTIYVILEDAVSGETVAETTTTAQTGYSFRFDRVARGQYVMYASTDLDGNGVLLESGEVIGLFGDALGPQVVELRHDIEGLVFDVFPLVY